MTSLKPFMNASRTTAAERKTEALERVASMLLQGIALHSFESNTEPAAKFQNAIRKVRSDFDKVEDQDSALLLAGSAIQLMEDYNNSVERRAQARQNEFEAVIALLAEALLEVSRASAETMVAFKEIERDLASASGVDSLRRAKERLAIAVDSIRDAVANPLAHSAVPHGEVDSATGLPDYGFAADAMAQVWQTRDRYYAAIFSAERLETINMRFGFAAGDQVLRTLSGHVAKSLASADRLFRWRGPCLMALIRRDAPEALVAAELARTAQAKLEQAITMGGREAMVAISTTWSLFPLRTAAGIDDVLGQMNTFAAGRVPARRETAVSRARA